MKDDEWEEIRNVYFQVFLEEFAIKLILLSKIASANVMSDKILPEKWISKILLLVILKKKLVGLFNFKVESKKKLKRYLDI